MAESDLIPFTFWSILTGVIIVVSGLSYMAFLRRRKSEKPSA
jgi:heme/copper-type cytochrome/quinol oxidase subunit 2